MNQAFSVFLLLVALSPSCLHAQHDEAPLPADKALESLMEGNKVWKAKASLSWVLPHPRRSPAYAQQQAEGQNPDAVLLTCMDTRVQPNLIFHQGFGDIMEVRNAGEVLDGDLPGQSLNAASIEYPLLATKKHTNLIVVMGHTSCGAVHAACVAAVARLKGEIPKLPTDNLQKLAEEHIKPRVKAGDSVEECVRNSEAANVFDQIDRLFFLSPKIREKVSSGEVKLVPMLYHIDSLEAERLDEKDKEVVLRMAKGGSRHDANAAIDNSVRRAAKAHASTEPAPTADRPKKP